MPASTLNTGLFAVYNAELNANDSFGSNNGTAVGGLTYTTGKIGTAFQFNGTNAYVSLPNSSGQFNFTGDFSVSMWFRSSNLSTSRYAIGNYKSVSGYGYGWILHYSQGNNGFTFSVRNGSVINEVGKSQIISINTWYHVVAVRKMGQIHKLYVNGVDVLANQTDGNVNNIATYTANQPMNLGGLSDISLPELCDLDGVNMWNRALTPTEVTELYRCGSGIFYPYVSLPTLDSDACAFIGAASITDTTQQSAINQLVLDLKTANIWTKMKALYPFVGGTASSHRFNLKAPTTNASDFYLIPYGGITHSSNGVQFDGATGYFDTQLIPLSILTQTSSHLCYYSRTDSTNANDMGGQDDISPNGQFYIGADKTNASYSIKNIDSMRVVVANTNTQGMFLATRTASNSLKGYKNGVLKGSNTNTTGAGGMNIPATIGGFNYRNSGGAISKFYGNKQFAFASIGDGLTDSEVTAFYNAVQTFNTTLGRQV